MAYTPTAWVDRVVSTPNTYTKSAETSGQVTLVASPGTVTQVGTSLNATNMNKLEAGVAAAIAKGVSNVEINDVMTLFNETDTRSVVLTRDAITGSIIKVEEKDASTVLRTTNITWTLGQLTSVSIVCNGKTSTITLAYTANKLTGYTKTVV